MTAAVVDRVGEEQEVLDRGLVGGVDVALDRHVHDVDARVGARGDETAEHPAREPAESGREHLVGADPDARCDAVRGEAVQRAGDAARHPGAVTLEVAVAAVAQALAVDHAEAEERPQVVAGDEVAAELLVDDAVQLAVVGVDAAVEHCDRDRAVAGRAAPGGLDVHAVVVPLEERVPGIEVDVVAIGGRAVAVPLVPQVVAPVGGEERVGEVARDERLRGDARVEARRGRHDRECVDRAQVADDDSAGSGDRRAHLSRRRAGREPDHGDTEGIAGGGGRSCDCERGGKRRKEKGGPHHRDAGFGKPVAGPTSPVLGT